MHHVFYGPHCILIAILPWIVHFYVLHMCDIVIFCVMHVCTF